MQRRVEGRRDVAVEVCVNWKAIDFIVSDVRGLETRRENANLLGGHMTYRYIPVGGGRRAVEVPVLVSRR